MAGTTAGDGTVGKALDVLDQVAAFGRPSASPSCWRQPVPQGHALPASPDADLRGCWPTTPSGIPTRRACGWCGWPMRPGRNPRSRRGAAHLTRCRARWARRCIWRSSTTGRCSTSTSATPREPVEMFSQAGKVGPAYCTGVGKAMLAFLPTRRWRRRCRSSRSTASRRRRWRAREALLAELAAIRARGHAFDDEEHEPGIICIAVPILTRSGRVLGALSSPRPPRGRRWTA
jgi:IclR family transcriptional regulator, KDG regulon repressor